SLTPLIDVVFILLVFFMLATRFGEWKDLPVNVLPAEESADRQDKNWLTLTVTSDGRVAIGEHSYAIDELSAHQGGGKTVLITGEPEAPLQAALATLDAVRAAGIEDVQLELIP